MFHRWLYGPVPETGVRGFESHYLDKLGIVQLVERQTGGLEARVFESRYSDDRFKKSSMVLEYIDHIQLINFKPMYYIVYKTTNNTNNKFYIGYHQTENLEDNYLGSGLLIKQAILKYGKDNFKRDILYVFPSREEALLKESEIVNEKFLKNPQTYNLRIGGDGGWEYINNILNSNIEYKNEFKKKVANGVKKAILEGKLDESFRKNSERFIKMNIEKNPFLNKKHSEGSKKCISENNGSRLSVEEVKKRLNDLRKIQFGYGWKSRISKLWGISHQNVNYFLDHYLIGSKVLVKQNFSGLSMEPTFFGKVISYTSSEEFGNLLFIKIIDFEESDLACSRLIGINEDIIDFIPTNF